MAVLWFIIIIQFGLIGWLTYRNLKPAKIDYWQRAQDMIERWKKSDEDNWVSDFKQAQGIIEPPKPVQAKHELIDVKKGTYMGMPRLKWECSCGEDGDAYSANGVDYEFAEHQRASKLVEKYKKG